MIKLSDRLQAVASLCPIGARVADIGTDHGYLPIYLIEAGIASKAFAMDLREGPLNSAADNIKSRGLEGKITTRLSDGLEKLESNEADVITICGMGQRLISDILTKGADKIRTDTTLILSPQSEIREFRLFLLNNGFIIDNEDIILDDGKYYFIFVCKKADTQTQQTFNEAELRFGKLLLERKNPVLKSFLLKEKSSSEAILDNLKNNNPSNVSRIDELSMDIQIINQGLQLFI